MIDKMNAVQTKLGRFTGISEMIGNATEDLEIRRADGLDLEDWGDGWRGLGRVGAEVEANFTA